MSVFSVRTTVTHRYYAKRRKSEIVRRIRDLRAMLKQAGTWVAPALDAKLALTDAELVKQSASDLAWLAIRLHTYFPEEDSNP